MKFRINVFKKHGDENVLSDPDKEFDSIDRAQSNEKTQLQDYAKVFKVGNIFTKTNETSFLSLPIFIFSHFRPPF